MELIQRAKNNKLLSNNAVSEIEEVENDINFILNRIT